MIVTINVHNLQAYKFIHGEMANALTINQLSTVKLTIATNSEANLKTKPLNKHPFYIPQINFA